MKEYKYLENPIPKHIVEQIRTDAIDEYKYALLNLIHQIPQKCIGGANVKEVAEQLKSQN